MKGRVAKIVIVAMARKPLVALWRFAEDGVIPEGAAYAASSRAFRSKVGGSRRFPCSVAGERLRTVSPRSCDDAKG